MLGKPATASEVHEFLERRKKQLASMSKPEREEHEANLIASLRGVRALPTKEKKVVSTPINDLLSDELIAIQDEQKENISIMRD